jgi:hypothetical protein
MVFTNDLLAELLEAGYTLTMQQNLTRDMFLATLVFSTQIKGQHESKDIGEALAKTVRLAFLAYEAEKVSQ